MTKKAEKASTKPRTLEEAAKRRYRSIAEIRRDFFPEAPVSLFETGPLKSQEDVVGLLDGENSPRV